MKRKSPKDVQKSLDANLIAALTIKQLVAFADLNNATLSIRFIVKEQS